MGSINLKVLLLLPPHRHYFLFYFHHSSYHYLSFSCSYNGLHVYFSLPLLNVLYPFWILHLNSDTDKFDVQKMERKETVGYLQCPEKLTPFSLKVRQFRVRTNSKYVESCPMKEDFSFYSKQMQETTITKAIRLENSTTQIKFSRARKAF